jgi:pimeloyl-ACP methyl ester carboxylesterase
MESGEYYFQSRDGLKIFGRVYPGPSLEAPVVLCLHGLLRNGRDFEDLAPRLSKRFRVIVPDMRGRGLSDRDRNASNYQVPVYISDVLQLLAGLGAPSVRIVGTSMGGIIAMGLAVLHPGVVSQIVLNDVGPELDPSGLARIRDYAGRSTPVETWEEAGAQLRNNFGIAWPDLPDERWSELARRCYRADSSGVLHADADPAIGDVIRASPGAVPDLWPLWKQLGEIPILALRGELSDLLSAGILARMQVEKPDLQAVVVRNRGHVPLLDEPEALAAIDRFLVVGDRPPR